MATIFALSSGALPSGVAVIRISGPQAFVALEKLGGTPGGRRALTLRVICDPQSGDILDRALTVRFEAPASFTGEDCAEIHCHGSRPVVAAVLKALGAIAECRLAEPGEFTRRAFENGKLDLTQVEGIGELIAAHTEAQRRQAVRRMGGGLAERLTAWRARIVGLRAEIEARLDFADEGDVGALPASFAAELAELTSEIDAALAGFTTGRLIRDGVQVALAGAPNAGKSTLLNRLARSDVAIVAETPGTTRDIVEVALDLGGYLFVVADTAGLRPTDDPAETEGVRRAGGRVAASDLVLQLIAPDSEDIVLQAPENGEIWRIGSKADLGKTTVPGLVMEISAQTGAGMEILHAALIGFAERRGTGAEAGLVSRARDRAHLRAALEAVQDALRRLEAPELLAEDLRRAGDAIGRLAGTID
ncbi:MAG TPA: tRNA uridine-5-carboxymethylaminomethyl(34) synthesis GTPase MnmE, partial [Devosiaceae bacterium]|nr:tRNA uridine-5-carboxymethylaminomethyl(34) synthesis GTPase MnmE [Devosiaceae bacterium]